MKYKFYNDAGHGWLAVKRTELARLGISDEVSSCSYQKGGTVYLEEDCDATLFVKKKKELGELFEEQDQYHGNYSRIRGYESYKSDTKTIAVEKCSQEEVDKFWCKCGKDSTFGSYPQDGECNCGVDTHHVHCGTCGKISQIG